MKATLILLALVTAVVLFAIYLLGELPLAADTFMTTLVASFTIATMIVGGFSMIFGKPVIIRIRKE